MDTGITHPTRAQLDALIQWASEHGRNWRQALNTAWMNGDYDGFNNSHLLQQVRNNFGPSWLANNSAWITSLVSILKGKE
jgi:hypothetical protein